MSEFGYSDIAELILVKLSGERPTSQRLASSETTMNISAQYDADGLGARLGVQATVHAPGDTDQAVYWGNAEYRVSFYGPAEAQRNAELIALLWPYLRQGLLEQAARLGAIELTVPLECPQLPPPDAK